MDFSVSGIPRNSAILAELTYLLTERIALVSGSGFFVCWLYSLGQTILSYQTLQIVMEIDQETF